HDALPISCYCHQDANGVSLAGTRWRKSRRIRMEPLRFASLKGPARQWLTVEELEPELSGQRQPRLRKAKPARSVARPLAKLGELLEYKKELYGWRTAAR